MHQRTELVVVNAIFVEKLMLNFKQNIARNMVVGRQTIHSNNDDRRKDEKMSADNFVGVRPQKVNGELTGKYEIFEYGNMSMLDEDCMYLTNTSPDHVVSTGNSDCRAFALVKAHDIVKELVFCEYGVVELDPIPDKPCGRCYVCVHERRIAK